MKDSGKEAVSESIWGHLFISALQGQISEENQIHPLNQKNELIWFWDSQTAFSLLPGLFESHSCEDNSSDKFSSSRMQNSDTSEKAEKANCEIELNAVATSCVLHFKTLLYKCQGNFPG